MPGPRTRLADAARALTPLEQGKLDSLCGVYAIINGIRLATYLDRDLSKSDLHRMFSAGLKTLQKARQLRDTMLHGMPPALWLKVCAEVLASANEMLDSPLSLKQLDPGSACAQDAVIPQIRRGIYQGHPVLFGVEGRLDHWTVAAGYSHARLTLFDSARHRWIGTATLNPIDPAKEPTLTAHTITYLVRRT
jgi:hypothetical protein